MEKLLRILWSSVSRFDLSLPWLMVSNQVELVDMEKTNSSLGEDSLTALPLSLTFSCVIVKAPKYTWIYLFIRNKQYISTLETEPKANT